MTKPQAISLDKIIIDGGTQMRVTLQESAVSEYCGLLSDAKQWPFDSPLTVFYDGTDYYLADGFHRYMAAKRAERSSAPCIVIAGSVRDAIKFALSANARHGLRRTNEDKRKAVLVALNDKEWGKLSSRAIAEICGVGPTMVDEMRKALLPVTGSSQNADTAIHGVSEPRVSKDGSLRSPVKQPAKVEDSAIESEPEGVPKKPRSAEYKAAEEAIANAEPGRELLSLVRTCMSRLKKLPELPGLELVNGRRQSIQSHLENASNAISVYLPAEVCPMCHGKKCAHCGNFGWVNRIMQQQLKK